MVEKIKTEKSESKNPKIGKRIGELAFATLPLLGLESSHDMGTHVEFKEAASIETLIERKAAAEVAQRFKCELTEAEDLHVAPPDGRFAGEKRTSVRLTINLETNPIAVDALKKYEDDTSVQWFPPSVVASREAIDLKNENYIETPLHKHPEDYDNFKTLTMDTYPRTTLPNGAQMRIYMKQSVVTADRDNVYTTEGFNPCGVIEWSITDHTWKLVADAPQEQPTVTYHARQWQKPKVAR